MESNKPGFVSVGFFKMYASSLLFLLVGMLVSDMVWATGEQLDACLRRAVLEADDNTTVHELKQECSTAKLKPFVGSTQNKPPITNPDSEILVTNRLESEEQTEYDPFVLTPYRTNYILFGAYNSSSPNDEPFIEQFSDEDVAFDHTEAKFQFSIKFPLAESLLTDRDQVFIGYTNRSFWQVYNKSISSPIRETVHEPDLWYRLDNDYKILGFKNIFNDVGLVHQSNGRGANLSRSWNRVYLRSVFQTENLFFSFKPWWRIQEASKDDDNPDIEDFMGNFELLGVYKHQHHTFSLMLRNNLDRDTNRGAIQLDWSFPFTRRLRGYIQWFNGYGESLIDYNTNVNSIGAGLQLTDWL